MSLCVCVCDGNGHFSQPCSHTRHTAITSTSQGWEVIAMETAIRVQIKVAVVPSVSTMTLREPFFEVITSHDM